MVWVLIVLSVDLQVLGLEGFFQVNWCLLFFNTIYFLCLCAGTSPCSWTCWMTAVRSRTRVSRWGGAREECLGAWRPSVTAPSRPCPTCSMLMWTAASCTLLVSLLSVWLWVHQNSFSFLKDNIFHFIVAKLNFPQGCDAPVQIWTCCNTPWWWSTSMTETDETASPQLQDDSPKRSAAAASCIQWRHTKYLLLLRPVGNVSFLITSSLRQQADIN